MVFPFINRCGDPGYWRDIGTVDSFWQANIDLLDAECGLQLHDPDWPIWTFERQHPPARFIKDKRGRHGLAIDSLVANGCVITGSTVQHSVISTNVAIGPDCEIADSVILPDAIIGRNCRLSNCVIDSDCTVPAHTVIGADRIEDGRQYFVTEQGVVLATKAMLNAKAAGLFESHVA